MAIQGELPNSKFQTNSKNAPLVHLPMDGNSGVTIFNSKRNIINSHLWFSRFLYLCHYALFPWKSNILLLTKNATFLKKEHNTQRNNNFETIAINTKSLLRYTLSSPLQTVSICLMRFARRNERQGFTRGWGEHRSRRKHRLERPAEWCLLRPVQYTAATAASKQGECKRSRAGWRACVWEATRWQLVDVWPTSWFRG